MKHPKLADAAIVAALLLAYVPGLAEDVLVEFTPAALIAPAVTDEAQINQDNSASGL